jgi:hypothetical protein
VDFARAAPHRSSRYSTVLATELTREQLLQMAWVIAAGFARREPQARHLRPPKHPPAGLMEARHTDPFGTDSFGSWDTQTQLYWVTRLTALTDPTTSADAIEVNEETLAQSLAILDAEGRVIGAAFNETMPPFDVEPPFREDDPFLDTVLAVWEPVYGALGAQDAEALTALSERYPAFREAYAQGKVSHHILIARSDDLPKEDTFELEELKPGDLLFWTGTYAIERDPPITHAMIYLGRKKGSNQRIMVGASDGRTYEGESRYGVSIFDFKIPKPAKTNEGRMSPNFIGYGQIPGL